MTDYAIALRDVEAARERIALPFTPVMTSHALDGIAGRQLFFKCESFQKTGSFKARGALNAVRALDAASAPRGVVTHSSGNHAQALAWAASTRGIPCYVVMPTNAPDSKRAAVIGYGGRITDCEPTLAARVSGCAKVQAETGATLVPPFDHPLVIAGQGTIALELLEQVPDLTHVIVPVGGGGLIAGITLALRERRPDVIVVGAEPANADDAARSKASGERLEQLNPNTIADGLRTSLGDLTWPVVRDLVARIVTPSEAEIAAAMRLVFTRLKVVIEPSAGVSAAVALRAAELAPTTARIGVVLCGGNVDLDHLPW
jgi:threonine dehydratase/serine racemase